MKYGMKSLISPIWRHSPTNGKLALSKQSFVRYTLDIEKQKRRAIVPS